MEFIFINNKLFLDSEQILKFLESLTKTDSIWSQVDEDTKLKMTMGMEYFKDCLQSEIDKLKVGIELNQMGFPDKNIQIRKFEVK